MKRTISDLEKFFQRGLRSASNDPKLKMDALRDRIRKQVLARAASLDSDDQSDQLVECGLIDRLWQRVAILATASLVLAIVVGSFWLHRTRSAVSHSGQNTLTSVNAGIDADRSSAQLEVGDAVQTLDAGQTLMLADGSLVEVKPRSELALERAADGLRIRLSRGGIIVNAANQASGHLYVQTKDALISVVGTVFLVNAEEEGSRVAVVRGEVHVQQGGEDKALQPGEQVVTSLALMALPVREELSWSRQAPFLIAEWQQSAVTLSAGGGATESQEAFTVVSVRLFKPENGGRGSAPALNGCGGLPPRVDPAMFSFTANLYTLIASAYTSGGCLYVSALDLLKGGPAWARSDQYVIRATMPEGFQPDNPGQLSNGFGNAPKLQAMLRKLLEDRFKLVLRREQKEMQVLLLKPFKNKTNLTRSGDGDKVFSGSRTQIDTDGHNYTRIEGGKATMTKLATTVAFAMRQPVIDRTGIAGDFNFTVEYDPEGVVRPTLNDALKEQLGLEIQDTRALVEYWVIERLDRPTEN